MLEPSFPSSKMGLTSMWTVGSDHYRLFAMHAPLSPSHLQPDHHKVCMCKEHEILGKEMHLLKAGYAVSLVRHHIWRKKCKSVTYRDSDKGSLRNGPSAILICHHKNHRTGVLLPKRGAMLKQQVQEGKKTLVTSWKYRFPYWTWECHFSTLPRKGNEATKPCPAQMLPDDNLNS